MSQKFKQMPEDEVKKQVKQFLKERKVLVLCTCSDNVPRATPMDFYIDKKAGPDDFTIYVGPAPGRKVNNLKENPNISVGIYTPMDTGKVQGMQITASGKNLVLLEDGNEGFEHAQKLVRGKRKLLLKIIPEKIELLDYDFLKRGYSRLQVLEF